MTRSMPRRFPVSNFADGKRHFRAARRALHAASAQLEHLDRALAALAGPTAFTDVQLGSRLSHLQELLDETDTSMGDIRTHVRDAEQAE